MEITGEQVVHAPRDSVYAALHDPAVLQRAIPGCQRFTQIEPTRYEAEIALKIGPIASTFVSAVSIFNVDPPMGYSLRCRANGGGTVGGADGTAHVALAVIDAHTTNLAYHLSATPHGRVAEVSKEMLLKKARTLVAEFFSRLDMNLEGAHARAKARHDAIASDAAILPGEVSQVPTETDGEQPRWSAVEPPVSRPKAMEAPAPPPLRDSEPQPTQRAAQPAAPAPEPRPIPLSTLDQQRAEIETWSPAPRKRRQLPQDSDRHGIGRWILAALGALAIALLLYDGF